MQNSKQNYSRTKANLVYGALIALASALILASAPVYAEKEELYHVYGDAPTGTRLKPKIISSPTPLDASYEELSEEHKAKIRANYSNMPETDEPPFPTGGLMPIWEAISEQRHPNDQRGKVMAVATVNAEGKVEKVAMYDTTSTHMTKLVANALMYTPFKPAVCNGEPCEMDFILEATLNIDLMRF